MGAYRNTNAPLITLPAGARFDPYIDPNEMAEKSIVSNAAVMVNGTDIFTITGGPIVILDLVSLCITANGATASTLQWQADGTVGAATTISGASATLANAAAGTIVATLFTATSTALAIYTAGVGISRAATTAAGMIVPAGIIETVIGVGSTTGTWQHHMRYRPLMRGVTVTLS